MSKSDEQKKREEQIRKLRRFNLAPRIGERLTFRAEDGDSFRRECIGKAVMVHSKPRGDYAAVPVKNDGYYPLDWLVEESASAK